MPFQIIIDNIKVMIAILRTLNLFIFFQVYFLRTHPVFIYTSINCTNISICVKLYKYK